ncbi:uncharacterized protein LOC111043282 [Nilaparvata lugens]|uniref:uncharacterized protein LOC111043282 n=1 Tax=Nilaparvata lugens TaxID=108931 RepID=UPI000B9940D9|nr:uncharacterized protein LOC111043282 [Nilaparvata lugens]
MEVYGKEDLKERAIKSLKQSLARLWRRRSVTITEYDPCYKVAYLGNVITGWAKGDGCVEKPLCTLWKNYNSSSKPDVQMKLTVTQSGLKAVTKQHGLTEYWSHRVTYCAAPAAFPKVFCWVYRHEGRKLKQELRCHAVLCRKESTAQRMADELSIRLVQALSEFKRDKLSRQNARLSLANAVYDNPSLPRRKILLSTGSHNYRPPLERSKSAPKLMSIEESLEEYEEAELRKSFRRPRFNSSFARVEDFQQKPSSKPSELFRRSIRKCAKLAPKIDSSSLLKDTVEERADLLAQSLGNKNDDNNNDELQENKVVEDPSGEDDVNDEERRKWVPGDLNFDEDDDMTTDTETDDVASRVGSSTSEEECALDDLSLHLVGSGSYRDIKEEEDDDILPTGYREATTERLDSVGEEEDDDDDDDNNCLQVPGYSDDYGSRSSVVNVDSEKVDDEALPNSYNTNSLVRDRKKMFERLQQRSASVGNIEDVASLGHLVQNNQVKQPYRSALVQNRRKMFETPFQECVVSFPDKSYLELEEDSTPSLQSISSGSDTSSKADLGLRNPKPHYDLDSLSEEDSDESGYVESVPVEGSDDKERDLPHHQLMKACVLTPKTACLQV